MSKSSKSPTRRFSKWLIGGVLLALILVPLAGFAGAQLENNDAFCASCHTEPESTYVDRSHAGTAVDLASFHSGEGIRCIDCHSGEGVNGRIHAMSLGARDALKFVSGNFPQPAPLTRPIGDDKCLKCHSDIADGRSFENHFHVFLPEWQKLTDNAATCVDCHQSHTTNGQAQIAFLNEQHTVQTCNKCHQTVGEG
ncbi:MAG: hypothetical protein ACE5EY_14075 [Anaerolineae bacterium]